MRVYSPWLEPTELSAQVTIPHGGEVFRSGSIRNIRWLSGVPSSQGLSDVEIQLSLNGDSGPWETIAQEMPNNGHYQWVVDASSSDNCRMVQYIQVFEVEQESDEQEIQSSASFTDDEGKKVQVTNLIPVEPNPSSKIVLEPSGQ